MTYWTCVKYRDGVKYFIKYFDQAGYPFETQNEYEAWRFYDLDSAMFYFNMGYCVMKH